VSHGWVFGWVPVGGVHHLPWGASFTNTHAPKQHECHTISSSSSSTPRHTQDTTHNQQSSKQRQQHEYHTLSAAAHTNSTSSMSRPRTIAATAHPRTQISASSSPPPGICHTHGAECSALLATLSKPYPQVPTQTVGGSCNRCRPRAGRSWRDGQWRCWCKCTSAEPHPGAQAGGPGQLLVMVVSAVSAGSRASQAAGQSLCAWLADILQ
jgi:hypothetical protein